MATTDHHNCRMGKWYYEGEGKEMFANTQAYKMIEAPHTALHKYVSQTLECISRKDCRNIKTKDSIIKNMTAMEESSAQLFALLEKMVQEANPA
ncbi:MAG: CZB domain-containing protein [Epsilonproteobacteria bacterium]|nr:CZB domain-containing protein [Campylobacterota bacterium]